MVTLFRGRRSLVVLIFAVAVVQSGTSLFAQGRRGRGSDQPNAVSNGWIYDDFDAGVATAEKTGKPLMVVLRCPP